MKPLTYNANHYSAMQNQAEQPSQSLALMQDDELLSKSETILIMAALCTLAASILSVVVL